MNVTGLADEHLSSPHTLISITGLADEHMSSPHSQNELTPTLDPHWPLHSHILGKTLCSGPRHRPRRHAHGSTGLAPLPESPMPRLSLTLFGVSSWISAIEALRCPHPLPHPLGPRTQVQLYIVLCWKSVLVVWARGAFESKFFLPV
jgi:hypothetical protein